jgi:ribosomal-protein-alanine N-acetyltransferase
MRLWLAPQGLHVEPAGTGDDEALARLHAQGFFRGWPRSDFAAYLADPVTTPTYVACDSRRRIAGFAMLRISGEECELLTIAVDRKWRGKGVAQALMRAMFADLLATPTRRMFLEVDEENAPALKLYRRFDFVVVGNRKGYYPKPDGSVATALVMRADLG